MASTIPTHMLGSNAARNLVYIFCILMELAVENSPATNRPDSKAGYSSVRR